MRPWLSSTAHLLLPPCMRPWLSSTAHLLLPPSTYRSIESVEAILHVLRNTSHNGFPVWVHEADLEGGEYGEQAGEDSSKRLEGIILRSQLLVLLQRRHFVDSLGNPVRGGGRGRGAVGGGVRSGTLQI